MTHTLNHLSFGSTSENAVLNNMYGVRMNNELDGERIDQSKHVAYAQMHVEYVVDITELEYEDETRWIRAKPADK